MSKRRGDAGTRGLGDRELRKLIFEAIVPAHLRPETPAEIDAMLDSIGYTPMDEAKIARMVRKVRESTP